MDDINILTASPSIQRNCINLGKAYLKCIEWAGTHGSKFNPEKSKLIHFIGQRRLKTRAISLEGSIIEPSKTIKVLGAYLDQGLTGRAHLRAL